MPFPCLGSWQGLAACPAGSSHLGLRALPFGLSRVVKLLSWWLRLPDSRVAAASSKD